MRFTHVHFTCNIITCKMNMCKSHCPGRKGEVEQYSKGMQKQQGNTKIKIQYIFIWNSADNLIKHPFQGTTDLFLCSQNGKMLFLVVSYSYLNIH